ncbi:4271_t:CDS:2 [Dentiscutata erythropus]|uniref:4271_t:CDS:1 n=1 Tax=Dentiscutata erythropus TaxID=1348616 RepID=A0A9N9CZL9_9GLOM|nr:4271_t:CDS:2 [Dentiscutata erythropus]
MDGNRRFARKMNYKQSREGYFMGYDKLQEVLNICLHLGVKVVTIYAFSIENFKRPKEEVDTLMELAKNKFVELCEKRDEITSSIKSAIKLVENSHIQISVIKIVIFTVNCFWPEFSLWEMLPIILEYQLSYKSLKEKDQSPGCKLPLVCLNK